jgi:methylenetetrahydrofolate dehydrogenase (NADP+)/methenyltetrahydrofolate cyclohydrolase
LITTKIIDGKAIATNLLAHLQQEAAALQAALAIILIGSNEASNIYVEAKMKQAAQVGITCQLLRLSHDATTDQVLELIDHLNQDIKVHGIILQMPTPGHIDLAKALAAINPAKDIDGLHPVNAGKLMTQNSDDYFVPCTALGCLAAILSVQNDVSGQNVAIVNRSNLVGKPLCQLLLRQNATVTMCHSFTQDLATITSNADIVVCAVGISNFFDRQYFKKGAIIIDVGISRVEGQKKIHGDVNFQQLMGHAAYITPVPGGIGPLTVAFLLSNTVMAAAKANSVKKD